MAVPGNKKEHERYMSLALEEARKAEKSGEVPVGAVLVLKGKILASSGNRRIVTHNPLGHAEMEVLAQAAQKHGTWRFDESTLYVTLEPCIMCCGALLQARVQTLCYGARDPRCGGAGTLYNIPEDRRLPFRCNVHSGILEKECKKILQEFFLQKRKRRFV